MKNILKKAAVLGFALSCLMLSACAGGKSGRKTNEEVVILYCDSWIMDNYMNAISDYDHVIYERYYFDHGRLSVGPTESGFRGIVYLTDEEAERLAAEYEWEEVTPSDINFEKIDTGFTGDGPCYSCKKVDEDNYSAVNVYYTYFDGKKLIFDIHQT